MLAAVDLAPRSAAKMLRTDRRSSAMAHPGWTMVRAGGVALAFGWLMGCGGGGTSGVTPDARGVIPDARGATFDAAPRPTVLAGTAAMGGPIAGATVTAKDQTGATATATTDSAGKFSIDVGSLAGP